MGTAILLAGSSASAAKYLVAFSGVMASGTDSGLFGAPGDLTGKIFVATYLVDTTNEFHAPPGTTSVMGAPASLTINGVTNVFPTNNIFGNNANAAPGRLDFFLNSILESNPHVAESISNTAFSPWFQGTTLDFGTAATISVTGGGSYFISICCSPQVTEVRSSGTFLTDTVTVTPVPEPATWAMMITGFGLAGAALRRRRAIAA